MERHPGTDVPLDIAHRNAQGAPEGMFRGGGSGRGPMASVYTVGAPWVERPPGASDFQLFSTLAAQTNANTPASFPNAFQVPSGNVAVIRSVSILANNLLVTSDLVWTLRYNGSAVQGWNNLTINPRAAASVEVSWGPDETYIPVTEGALIDVRFRVGALDGGTYQVSVTLHGWFYPLALHDAAVGAY